jgi:peptidoglycan/LPS O-acetylase OafA/YrhL
MIVGQPMAVVIFAGSLYLPQLHLPVEPRIVDVAVSGSFALVLFALIRSGRTYPHWLAPLCRYGAGYSYTLYATHFPLMVLLVALFLAPAHQLSPSGGLLLGFAGVGLVSIVYGYWVSAMTEANTSQLRRWLKGKFLRPANSAA